MEVVDGVIYAPAKDFWGWFDEWIAPWKPLTDALSEAFGAPFHMQHTGGGCMAIEALLEGGFGVMITEAEDVLGRWEDRTPTTGYAVGVYPLEECDCWHLPHGSGEKCDHKPYPSQDTVGWASSPAANTTEELIVLIKLAVASVNHHEPNAAGTGYMNHIDPRLLEA